MSEKTGTLFTTGSGSTSNGWTYKNFPVDEDKVLRWEFVATYRYARKMARLRVRRA